MGAALACELRRVNVTRDLARLWYVYSSFDAALLTCASSCALVAWPSHTSTGVLLLHT